MVPKYLSEWLRFPLGRKCDVLSRDTVPEAKGPGIRGGLTDSALFGNDGPRLVFVLIRMVRPYADSVTYH
jgi:hypothetical protein